MEKSDRILNLNNTLKILAGEEKLALIAFEELYDQHAPHIYHAATKFLKSDELVKDIVQDVFAVIWEKRQQLAHVENFEFYLYGVVKKMAYSVIKKKVREELARKEHAVISSFGENPYKEKYAEHLEKIMGELPPERRQVMHLVKNEGLKYKVVAERLNISVNMVGFHVHKALEFIDERKQDLTTFIFLASAVLQWIIISHI